MVSFRTLNRAALAASGLFFISATPFSFAQDSGSEENSVEIRPVEAADIDGLAGEAIPLTLREVVLATLANNLDVQIVARDRDVAGEEVLANYGIYDPTFTASVARERTDRQTTTFFGNQENGRVVTYTTGTNVESGITQRTPLGTILSISASHNRTDDHLPMSTFGGGVVDPAYTARAGVSATQPLLKNAGLLVNNAEIRISKKQLEQANRDFEEQVQDRIADVATAYWNLDFAIRNLDVQRQALASAQELERVNRARVDVGTLPRLSLLQAQAQVAERESLEAEAESQVVDAQDRLLQLMNWNTEERPTGWDRAIRPVDLPTYIPDIILDDARFVGTAMENRPDYKRELLGLDIADINRRVSRWQQLPELNAFGGIFANGLEDDPNTAWDTTGDRQYTDWNFGLEFRYPLFNRAARGEARQAVDRLEQQELRLDNLELRIVREVRSATRDIRTATKQIEATNRQVIADIEKLESERKRQQVGERTTFDVLDFQDDLAESRANQARALADFQIALIELGRSIGVLLDFQGVVLEDMEAAGGWDVFSGRPSEPSVETGEAKDWDESLQLVPRQDTE